MTQYRSIVDIQWSHLRSRMDQVRACAQTLCHRINSHPKLSRSNASCYTLLECDRFNQCNLASVKSSRGYTTCCQVARRNQGALPTSSGNLCAIESQTNAARAAFCAIRWGWRSRTDVRAVRAAHGSLRGTRQARTGRIAMPTAESQYDSHTYPPHRRNHASASSPSTHRDAHKYSLHAPAHVSYMRRMPPFPNTPGRMLPLSRMPQCRPRERVLGRHRHPTSPLHGVTRAECQRHARR